MQIGQTIWAIDPCYDRSGENPRLTVGESYEVISISDDEIEIKNDFGREHYFTFENFDKYFSLTPPKEKEGELKLIELGNYGYLAILDGKHIVVHTVDKERALELLQRFDFSWSKVENIIATNIY